MHFQLTAEDPLLYLSWSSKSPKTEADMHRIGGRWEDFNMYRFPFQEGIIKKVYQYAKLHGTIEYMGDTKTAIKELFRRSKEAEALTKGDADAEVSPALKAGSPKAADALRPYQRAGVKFLESRSGSLMADEPGLGKTLQTIASVISSGITGDILVLAPTVAANISWPEEIRKWSPKDEVLVVAGTRQKRQKELAKLKKRSSAQRRWVLCNTEMVRTEYYKDKVDKQGKVHKSKYAHHYPELFFLGEDQKVPRKWEAIIVDEAHNSLITKKTRPYEQTLTRRGFSKLETTEDGKRIAISGTPFRGKPENLWGILNWLYPTTYKVYNQWLSTWFDIEYGFFGGKDATLKETAKKDFYKSIQPIMVRRTKGEVAPDLPPKMYAGSLPPGVEYDHPSQAAGLVGHWLEMTPKQAKAYREMKEMAEAALDNGTLVANGVLAELTRLKQFATCYGNVKTVQKVDEDGDVFDVPTFDPSLPSNKFEWLVEFLQELGIDGKPQQGGRKVVIASQFTSIINTFAEALEKKFKGLNVLKITGSVSMEDREFAVDKFQNDDNYPVMMLNTKAGGVALTLDRADDIVILDETFIPDDQTQVEDRIHRVSRMHNVTVHYVRSIGTIEEAIARKTIDRDNLQKQLLDGSRGVAYARQLLGGNSQ